MKSIEIGLFDTKTRLSEIVHSVEKGQIFYITKRGKRVAELRPIAPEKSPLTPGCAASPEYWMAADIAEIPEGFEDYTK
jgi:prevent-host-death family protein